MPTLRRVVFCPVSRRALLVAALVVGSLLGRPGPAAAQHERWQAAAPAWTAPLPVPIVVLRAFDPPLLRWRPGHRGVDLAAQTGATVGAAGAGVVSFAGPLAGRGVVVVIHGSLRTTYEPVTPSVAVGARVFAGDPIGVLQAGHDPSRPSRGVLHWGLLRGEVYLDPMSLLAAARPVRLLPIWGADNERALTLEGQPGVIATTAGTRPAVAAPATGSTRRSTGGGALALGGAAVALVAISRRPP